MKDDAIRRATWNVVGAVRGAREGQQRLPAGRKRKPLTARQEEIAVEIARLLQEKPSDHPPVLDKVRTYVGTLSRVVPWAKNVTDRHKNKAHAEKLIKAIDNLEQLLASAPALLAMPFFLEGIDELERCPLGEFEQRVQVRQEEFYAQLAAIRRRCVRPVGVANYGHHHRYDLAAKWCAQYGAELMEETAPRARISSSSSNSLFRKVSSLLYEAVTGREADLERACDQVIRERQLGQ
jgi:hypothetical protein